MTSRRSFLPILAAVIALMTMLASSMSFAGGKTGTGSQERAVAFARIGAGEYQNFVVNWDENKVPVLRALLRTPAQYGAVFHPAPVMGTARPFAPQPNLFETEQILVVARVTAASEDMDKVFEVERVVESGTELILAYRFNEPKTPASYTMKNHLCLRIPKRAYTKVSFYENGKLAGELNTAAGQWSVPALAQKE